MLFRRHAFADLKPYTCCAGKGECDLVMFPDRNSWFDHELQYHRHEWICLMCQSDPFRSLEEFRSHIKIKHNEVPVDQISDIIQISQQQLNRIPATDCPFCDEFSQKLRSRKTKITAGVLDPDSDLVDARQFRNHVASHMDQLALFAIGPDASSYNISPQRALENTELQLRQLCEIMEEYSMLPNTRLNLAILAAQAQKLSRVDYSEAHTIGLVGDCGVGE